MTETIPEMRKRHRREIIEAVTRLGNQRMQQVEAAPILGLTPQGLNAIIQRNGIHWPVKKNGTRLSKREDTP